MNFYVTLTTNCNLKCSYCYGKSCEDFGSDFHGLSVDYSVPSSLTYSISGLEKFLREEDSTLLIFYGGEPLLQIKKLKEIMDSITSANFVLQTNGILLDKLEPEYGNRFDSIFVSLDGDESVTDFYRGAGTYRRVARNLKLIRERGFDGEIVARMTIGEATDIDDQVLSLINDDDLSISSVHWQLDALFWQNDYAKRNFQQWVESSYNPRLTRLIRIWVDRMRSEGVVMRLYPFLGVMQSLLWHEPSRLRCGAGWSLFNIQTDGNITPCPVMAGMKDYYLGNIVNTTSKQLKDTVSVSEPCTRCDISQICGGRCLYANVTKLWGLEGFNQVCGTVRNMIESLHEVKPEVERLLRTGQIPPHSFELTKYNGCEVVP